MKIAVIGLGSMGRRRIRLMRQHYPDFTIIGIDSRTDRQLQAINEFGLIVAMSLNEVLDQIDAAFICTPPITHAGVLRHLLLKKKHVFCELNLVSDGYDLFCKYNDSVLFLSSTLLYRKDVQYIQSSVAEQRTNYIYHVGQYLPDWHPWENYKDFFVNEKRSNGCREVLAIELPWLIRAFGTISQVHIQKDTMSSLELCYPDNFSILLTHSNNTRGFLAVDVVSRKAMRRLEVYSENLHLLWDGNPDSLMFYEIDKSKFLKVSTYDNYDCDNSYSDNIIETAYLEEMKVFFDEIEIFPKKSKRVLYTFQDDLYTISQIDLIEGLA